MPVRKARAVGAGCDLSNVFDDFVPPKFTLLREEGGDNMITAPNCWGGYGFTVNTDKVAAEDQENETASIHGLYQFDAPSSPEKWGAHLVRGGAS